METVLEEVVSEIIDIIYYHHSLNKRSAIYVGNLDAGQQNTPLMSENKHTINLINILNTL